MELFKKPFPPLGLSNTGRNQALISQLRSETSTCCNSLLYSPQVPDGPENRANCRIPTPKPRQCPRSKSDHSNQRQREQGERKCAASYQVNRVLGQHHLNIIHGFKTLNVNGPLSSDQHPRQQQGPPLQSRPPLHRFHKFN